MRHNEILFGASASMNGARDFSHHDLKSRLYSNNLTIRAVIRLHSG
jgi:hypothetical protein